MDIREGRSVRSEKTERCSMPINAVCIQDQKIILPYPPVFTDGENDAEMYARFMRHLRHVPTSRLEIKILSAIQFTADMLGRSDAEIAKALVDLGLRAPRMAFPADFLKFADRALVRTGWDVGGASPSLQELKAHWDEIGEDKFAVFKGGLDVAAYRVSA
jgi:hypothetical protein